MTRRVRFAAVDEQRGFSEGRDTANSVHDKPRRDTAQDSCISEREDENPFAALQIKRRSEFVARALVAEQQANHAIINARKVKTSIRHQNEKMERLALDNQDLDPSLYWDGMLLTEESNEAHTGKESNVVSASMEWILNVFNTNLSK